MSNIFYKFIHLQLFNIKHKIAHLQIVWRQIFVFRKLCLSQTEENGCLWSYRRASLVSHFKPTRENDDLLSWETNKFSRYRTVCKSILKCGFPTKGIKLTRFVLFEILRVPQLWGTWFRPLVGSVRTFAKYKWDYGIRNFSELDRLVRFCICSQHRVFPLLDGISPYE